MSKKIKFLILILIIVFVCLILRYTYSKYIEEAYVQKKADVAMWNVKVNDQDITQDVNKFEITDFTWEEEAHVKTPKVAPGMKGKFKLKVETTGTQVALKYKIVIDSVELSKIADVTFDLVDYKINGEKKEFVIEKENADENIDNTTDENTDEVNDENIDDTTSENAEETTNESETTNINKNKVIEVVKTLDQMAVIDNLEINVEWKNIDDDKHNENDSLLGAKADTTLKLPITVTVEQIINPDFLENDPAKDFGT